MFPKHANGERNAVLRSVLVFLGDAMFVAGHLSARVASVAAALTVTLAVSTARWLTPTWIAAEYILFNLARLYEGSWVYFPRGADGFTISVFVNLIYYAVSSAVPLLWLRLPVWACPHIWSGGIIAAVLSNVALLATAFHLGGDGASSAIEPAWAFSLLAACVGFEALGFFLVWKNIVPKYRSTFWGRRTTQQHVELTLWEQGTYTGRGGHSSNDSRSRVLKFFANRYWPRKAKVVAWLHENWPEWQNEATRPTWFTKRWRGLFDDDWLPGKISEDDDRRTTRTSSWTSFRLASFARRPTINKR